MPEPYTLRPVQVAARLDVSISTVYAMLMNREIGYIKVRGQYRIRPADLEAYEARTWHAPVSTSPDTTSSPATVVSMSAGGKKAGTAYQLGQRIAAKQNDSSRS